MLVTFLVNGQDQNWRTVTGVLTHKGEPLIGQNVIVLGTVNGTITDIKGEFCLLAPTTESIYISIPQCFEQVVRELDVSTTTIHVKLNNKNERLTDKAWTKWKLERVKLEPKLKNLFGTINYQDQLGEICR